MDFTLLWGIIIPLSLSMGSMRGTAMECGHRNVEGLQTFGNLGNKSKYGESPWMVEILGETSLFHESEQSYEMLGGGALLSPKIVLTAAHLVKELQPYHLLVRAGEWDRNRKTERFPHQDRQINDTIVHEEFSRYGHSRYTNDIALLVLESPFDIEEAHIRPICLPTSENELDYFSCYLTGWGKINMESPENEMILKKIHLPIVPHSQCISQWKRFIGTSLILDQTLMCAGGEKGVDACDGDGGSPLVCPLKNRTHQYAVVGLMVTGRNCGMKGLPRLYTNILHFGPWLYEKLNSLGENFSYFLVTEK